MMMDDRTVYCPTGRVVTRRIGEDHLLVPVSGGVAGENVVFPLNETGLFVWESVSVGKTVGETAQEMTEAFDVSLDMAQQDCAQMVQALLDQKLLMAAEDSER